MTKTITQNRESGFTLLELLLVIGVAALLLIGGIATYRLVSEGNKTTEATRLLLTIRQQTNTMAQQSNGVYTGITFASATSSLTSPLVTSGTLRNQQLTPFQGNITITPATSVATDDALNVTFTKVPQSACTKMAAAINNPSEVNSVTVNGTAITIPVNAGNVASACNVTAATGNTIIWQFP